MIAEDFLTVTTAANQASRLIGASVAPRVISDLFYARKLDVDRCPVVGGRRLIPRDYFPALLKVLHQLQQIGGDVEQRM